MTTKILGHCKRTVSGQREIAHSVLGVFSAKANSKAGKRENNIKIACLSLQTSTYFRLCCKLGVFVCSGFFRIKPALFFENQTCSWVLMKMKDVSAKVDEYPENNTNTLKHIKFFGRSVVLKKFQCLYCCVILEIE